MHAAPGHHGVGSAVETAFVIPEASLGYWMQRLVARGIAHDAPEKRLGETALTLRDPDGMILELVATRGAESITGWSNGDVPAEHAIRGFAGVTLWVGDPEPTAAVLTDVFGFKRGATDGGRHRFIADGPVGRSVDLRAASGFLKGRLGAGTIHHVAFRAADDEAEFKMADAARALGLRPTAQLDRNYFRSVYFREPGGVLFEIATDDPGFAVDEPREKLGAELKLPPWYESRREEIAAALAPLN
jgi:glyoxalase family protein